MGRPRLVKVARLEERTHKQKLKARKPRFCSVDATPVRAVSSGKLLLGEKHTTRMGQGQSQAFSIKHPSWCRSYHPKIFNFSAGMCWQGVGERAPSSKLPPSRRSAPVAPAHPGKLVVHGANGDRAQPNSGFKGKNDREAQPKTKSNSPAKI